MQKIELKFLLLYKAFHALLVCLFYHTLYIKFMIQQIWCFRLWRKSGVTEIRPLLLLQRWYIDLKLLYDRSAVLSNSHTSLASNMCCKTKKNVMKFMFTVFDYTISHYFIFCIFADVYIIAIYENAWKNRKKVSLLCFIAIVTFLHSWIYKTFSCNKLNSIKAVQLLNWFRLRIFPDSFKK